MNAPFVRGAHERWHLEPVAAEYAAANIAHRHDSRAGGRQEVGGPASDVAESLDGDGSTLDRLAEPGESFLGDDGDAASGRRQPA